MATLKDLAAECGVSTATVSNVLNGKANVSEATRRKIISAIKASGYKPNFMARGLRAAKTKTVGLIVEDITLFSTPKIVEGIMSFCEERGYRTILENLRLYSKWGKGWYSRQEFFHLMQLAFREMISIKTDGIIYVAGHARKIPMPDEEFPIPTVLAYSYSANPGRQFIAIDDRNSARTMTEHLIANGHRKIALIKGTRKNIHTEERLAGFKDGLAAHGISFEAELAADGNWTRESGFEAAERIFSGGKEFSAFFCMNDEMAAGVYDSLRKRSLAPGEDISVAGFDGRIFSAYLEPPLTTMSIPLEQIGRKSAELLVTQIENADFSGDNDLIPCSLCSRKSVRNIN